MPDPFRVQVGVVQLGQVLSFTADEQRELYELSLQMAREATSRRKGWLRRYVWAWNRAGRIIRRGIERSHT